MRYDFNSGNELIDLCNRENKKIWEIMINREEEISGNSKEEIYNAMVNNLKVMEDSVKKGFEEDIKSVSGLIGGEAKLLKERYENNKTVSGTIMLKAVSSSMAVLEVNASMGRIIAAPTAGSCGIIPGVFITIGDEFDIDDDTLVKGLFTASAIGYIVAKNATVSGAEGGCQAETGTAAAMTAAAIVEIMGGDIHQCLDAASMTFKNIMGLVCDPVAGLVEVPCLKRNAIGAANALISVDMALAGIKSIIPFDEVVEAMYSVGKSLSHDLKETSLGGIAASKTGKKLSKEIFNK
ncbi:L-serine ammonia-lyase, iron-sulfur-dependent, subunit alpha [Dethiothermospora halolimnae]|uniref:L-serine ammonia-lyase, iron-sulfur-dependent, subunit alpha n=1 Tax=Dethiothermospora halolimnae TaxID=3114390 RepID=UPI003CCBE441